MSLLRQVASKYEAMRQWELIEDIPSTTQAVKAADEHHTRLRESLISDMPLALPPTDPAAGTEDETELVLENEYDTAVRALFDIANEKLDKVETDLDSAMSLVGRPRSQTTPATAMEDAALKELQTVRSERDAAVQAFPFYFHSISEIGPPKH